MNNQSTYTHTHARNRVTVRYDTKQFQVKLNCCTWNRFGIYIYIYPISVLFKVVFIVVVVVAGAACFLMDMLFSEWRYFI